jgi:class 3 adenylate cyclase
VRYDIYGKDVLIANKMESNGNPGRLMISNFTREILKKDKNSPYKLTFARNVEVSNFNMNIPAYFCEENV